MKRLAAAVCVFLVALLSQGCQRPAAGPAIMLRPPAPVTARRVTVGNSIQARPIECVIVGQGWQVTFIMAAIHGNEPAGTALLERLVPYLQQHPALMEGRRAILLPVANPDGLENQTRHNASDVDLNRNFPDDNRDNKKIYGEEALSEPEAVVIDEIITKYAPERIVSIHQFTEVGPQSLSARLPKGCIDYDGPAKALAKHMAKYCDLPVDKLGANPGSLGSYAGLDLGIPIITFELPLHAHLLDSDSLWEKYGEAIVAAVVYPDRVK
ncbi:MAG TPA: M14 family zinc carboxypeptidase [Sedimentisphaerales bacterium]|nr:M14 family zinc carboxypeptidase [Sedimentisphaerales bacterium]